MALAPGSILLVGYQADTNNGVTFLVLEPVLAGSVINFTTNDWDGASFGSGKASWTWIATGDIKPGTEVTISGGTSNLGTVEAQQGADPEATGSISTLRAYIGSSTQPTFLGELAGQFVAPQIEVPAFTAPQLAPYAPAVIDMGGEIVAATLRPVPNVASLLAVPAATASETAQDDGAPAPAQPAPANPNPAAEPQAGNDGTSPVFSDAADALTNVDTLIGGVAMRGGNDTLVNAGIIVATDAAAIDMGEGDDRVELRSGSSVYGQILLGAGNDTLTAADGDLDVDAGAGNDTVTAGEGDDLVRGGAGDDIIEGGEGDDALQGGDGTDRLIGGLGDDILLGGAGNDTLIGGEGNDLLDGGEGIDTADHSADAAGINANLATGRATGEDTGNDRLAGIENVIGGKGDDVLIGNAAANVLTGGEGNDRIVAGAGDTADGGKGGDTIEVGTGAGGSVNVDGGEGDDTVKLTGTGTGSLGPVAQVEKLIVEGGSWSVAASADFEEIAIKNGGTVTSGIIVDNDDHVSIEAGGKLSAATAITWQGGGNAVVENAGTIEGATRALTSTSGATGSLELNNLAGGVIRGVINPNVAAATAVVTLNNAGLIEANANGRVIDFQAFDNAGGRVVINNLVGGTIRNVAGSGDADVIRPGQNATINNSGVIASAEGLVGGGDAIDFQEGNVGGKVTNYATGRIEGSKHAVTGEKAVIVNNEGMMIGRNGSAVNIDNGGTEADRVTITNRGTMEGRSAELSNSDGDAIDVDGLATISNYGRIAGLGHEGYNGNEPNISEGIAIGGGTILNSGTGEIYGYGRAIQVDNSGNANALGKTFIVNDGLIKGDGHGPEGVAAQDAAKFDLRGNEAINLVGTYDDEIINNSAGRIVGGLSMGGGDDRLSNSGLIQATGGSAIDMGAGNDIVNLYVGSKVQGTVLLGDGDDRITMNGGLGAVTVDAGSGNDDITTSSGNDVIQGGDGNDSIFAEAGDDTIDAGAGDDMILADAGNDVIDGGAGFDTLFLAQATGPVYVDFAAGLVSGAGIGADRFTGIEKLLFGEGNDIVTGGNGDDSLDGAGGNDTLNGGSGDDVLSGSAGLDTLNGGSGDDVLDGGIGNDSVSGGSGDDVLQGGLGNDVLSGGSGDDRIEGGAGDDVMTGGSASDNFVFAAGFGNDRITDFASSGSTSDVIEFTGGLYADFSALLGSAAQVNDDVVITIDANTSLTLVETQLGSLSADDFRFA